MRYEMWANRKIGKRTGAGRRRRAKWEKRAAIVENVPDRPLYGGAFDGLTGLRLRASFLQPKYKKPKPVTHHSPGRLAKKLFDKMFYGVKKDFRYISGSNVNG